MKQGIRSGFWQKLILILICAVCIIFAVRGVISVLKKLEHYGNTAFVGSEQDSSENAPAENGEISPEDALPRNTYDADGFLEENGIRTYAADGMIGIAGIDVSSYQPEIDWAQVRDAGIEFAMIQLGYRGYSTGSISLDDCFLKHIDGALDAGLDVGVYFFSQALNPEEALEEAEFVLTWLEGYEIACPVVYDWEEVSVPARTDEMNMLMLTSCAEAFCRAIEEGGYDAAVYFNQAYGYEQLNLNSLRDYDFWLAEYADAPTFAFDFKMWQYTNEGTVPGIEGPVDLNIRFEKE